MLELGDARLGLTICEDIWKPGPPASDEALAGATLIVNASASPYHARQGRRARADADPARARQPRGRRVLQPGGRPGRAGLRRPLAASSTTRARCSPARRSSPRRCRSATVDLQAAADRAAARHAAAPAGARALPEVASSARWRARERPATAAPAATSRRCSSPRPRSTPRSCSACATTSTRTASSTSSSACRAASTRRWWPRRRRRARRRARDVRDDAVALLLVGHPARRRARWPPTSASSCSSCRSPRRWRPTTSCWPTRSTGRERGHHRGEPAGPHPRQPADGAVEQVRLAGADDRQQVGDLGRLLDALRRLGRRLRGHQGRAQDAGLPARRLPQRARRRASVPESIIDRAAERRAARRPARRRLAAATTTCSTRSSRATSSRTSSRDQLERPACPSEASSA